MHDPDDFPENHDLHTRELQGMIHMTNHIRCSRPNAGMHTELCCSFLLYSSEPFVFEAQYSCQLLEMTVIVLGTQAVAV